MPNQRAEGITPHTVAFPDDLWSRAQEASMMLEVSVSAVVRTALVMYLQELEKD